MLPMKLNLEPESKTAEFVLTGKARLSRCIAVTRLSFSLTNLFRC